MSIKPVKKAIFPVGGLGTRFLPATKAMPKEMLPIVDKPLIQYAVEEALSAGIEEIIFVTGRGKSAIEDHFDISYELERTLEELGKNALLQEAESTRLKAGQVFYTRQQSARGLGHAIWCARHFIHEEPFAVILADDFILGTPSCLQEMIEAHAQQGGNMVAIQNVPRAHVHRYGIIQGKEDGLSPLICVEGMIEKPSSEAAPSTLAIVGRYILYPEIFETLETDLSRKEGEIQLTDAMASTLGKRPFYGYRFSGRRFDCGNKVGMVNATLNVALSRTDLRDELLDELHHLQMPKEKDHK